MNALIDRLYATTSVEDADGNRLDLFPSSVTREDGLALYNLIRATRAGRTLETGMAYGLSTLFMCQALSDNGGGSHTAVDPLQHAKWRSIGLRHVERAGLSPLLRFLEDPSDVALPPLVLAGERFDVIFLDGAHRFDQALLDFYYADKLLRVGGHIMIDDLWMAPVRKVCGFVMRNRRYQPAPEFLDPPSSWRRRGVRLARSLAQTPCDAFALADTARLVWRGFADYWIVRKLADDDRGWKHYRAF